MTVFSKCYVLYQFTVIIVFYIPHFLVCLKLNFCVNCALYLSPYRLSYMAIRTIEMSLFILISGSPFLLIAPTDAVQNLEIYLVSSKYWLSHEKILNSLPYMEIHWNTNIYHCWCCFVYHLAYYFFVCILTHSEKSQRKPLAEEQPAHLGRRNTSSLCSSTASIALHHPGCPGRWLHTGLCIISGYIYSLCSVFVALAVLLHVIQEFFHVHCIPLYCFPKNQRRGGFELYLSLWKYFIACDYSADR